MAHTRWEALLRGDISLPVNETLGFIPVRDGADPKESVSFTWSVAAEHCNSNGHLQGGMLAAFADALLGAAGAAYLPDDQYPVLAEMKISIYRPAPAGTNLVGTGRIVKAGKRVLFSEAEVTDGEGRLIARASGTEIPSKA